MTAEGRPALLTADFDYPLPEDLVASHPADRREDSRLLVLDRKTGVIADRTFPDLLSYLAEGDALVINDTRVFPARLLGRKPTGARAEILLLRPLAEDEEGIWTVKRLPAAEDPIAQIEKLGKLKEQGLLTDEEFAAQKAKILGL